MFITRSSAGCAAAVIVAPACCVLADELHVPAQYPTIAAAVAASAAGDEIILADGEYSGEGNHDIVMPAHAITLRSGSGDPVACVIQMQEPGRVQERALRFTTESSSEIIVKDITMRGGSGGAGPGFYPIGGAVLVEGASPTFENCVFERNWAYGDCIETRGGAVYLFLSEAVFDRCVFFGNGAGGEVCVGYAEGRGGAVYVDGGSPTFYDCSFARNGVEGSEGAGGSWGGAVHVAHGSVTIVRGRFIENDVNGFSNGGALSVTGGDVIAIGCEFTRNRVDGYSGHGGAIAVSGGRLSVVNSTLIGNRAESGEWGSLGGAIHAGGGDTMVTNCLLAENISAAELPFCDPAGLGGAFGGAIGLEGSSTMTIQSTTIAHNHVAEPYCGGDAIYITDRSPGTRTLAISNSIIWGGERPIEMYGAGGSVEANFCILKGQWPGEQVLDIDPMFVDAPGGDYRLSAGSPAADAGANDLLPPDTFDLDGDGDTTEPLPLDLARAPRFTDDPAAPDTGRGSAPIVDMGAYETVVDGCYPDCDGSGGLDFFDFLCFQNGFAAGEPYADCDGSGEHDFFDFLCFQNAFAAGCP